MTITPLAITVLALLAERAMHPYEMYQLLRQRRVDRLVKVRPGSLYHTVTRLEGGEFVAAVATDRDGRRPERTIYAITEGGRGILTDRVIEMLGRPASEFPQFPLALAEAHNLDVDTVIRLLHGRVAHLEDELDDLESTLDAVLACGKPRMFTLHLDYQRTMRRGEIDWIRRTVGELAQGTLPWPALSELPEFSAPKAEIPTSAG